MSGSVGQPGRHTERADVQEALAALERAERFVAQIEESSIDVLTGLPDYCHAPAIATARADLAAALREAEERGARLEAALRRAQPLIPHAYANLRERTEVIEIIAAALRASTGRTE